MRRLVILFLAVLIIGLSVVPAFAAIDHTLYDYHSLLSFDCMYGSLDPGLKIDWPFNYVQPGLSKQEFSLASGVVIGDISSTNNQVGNIVNASFYMPTVAGNLGRSVTFTLNGESSQVIPRGYLSEDSCFMISADISKLKLSSVRISGVVKTFDKEVSLNDEKHTVVSIGFDQTFDCPNNAARISKNLNECLNGISEINGYYYVLLEDLSVEITCVRTDVDTPEFILSEEITLNKYGTNQWYSQYELKTNIVGPDQNLTTWLMNSVEAFLNFELLPGFSFSFLLQIILVVGLLLWFIKLLI